MNFPERLAVSSAAPPPLGFYSQELRGFIILALELCFVLWLGAGIAGSSGVPPCPSQFFSITRECGTASSADRCHTAPLGPPHHRHTASSLPQLPIPTPPTVLEEYFFSKSLVVRLLIQFDFLAVLVVFLF